MLKLESNQRVQTSATADRARWREQLSNIEILRTVMSLYISLFATKAANHSKINNKRQTDTHYHNMQKVVSDNYKNNSAKNQNTSDD